MKPFLFTFLVLASLSGCTRSAQLVTMRGSNVKPDSLGLVLDTDTLTLRYNFSSERGQMLVSVVNKLDRPLYIDWKRSAFIIGQDQFAYWQDVSDVNLATRSSIWNTRYGQYAAGSAAGTISKADPIGVVLPKTRVQKQQFVVVPRSQSYLYLPGVFSVVEEKPAWDPSRKKPVDIKKYTYSAEESPLQFRNYLTLSTDKDFKTEFVVDTKFWASDVRVLPMQQIDPIVVQLSDGSYSNPKTFVKPDGFYIPLPVQ